MSNKRPYWARWIKDDASDPLETKPLGTAWSWLFFFLFVVLPILTLLIALLTPTGFLK